MTRKVIFDPDEFWRQFHQKYRMPPKDAKHRELYSQKLDEKQQKIYIQTLENKNLNKKWLGPNARIIQRFWKKLITKDSLVPVNLNGNHSEFFLQLVNKQKVRKGINANKLKILLSVSRQAIGFISFLQMNRSVNLLYPCLLLKKLLRSKPALFWNFPHCKLENLLPFR